jgi:aspartate-semialdehyde dehydrogenase
MPHDLPSSLNSTSTMAAPHKVTVGILGATGTVGQRFLLLLSKHPYFVPTVLGASARSAGKKYADVVRWKQTAPIPDSVKDLVVHECEASHFKDCQVVFSGLDHDVAGDIGMFYLSSYLSFMMLIYSLKSKPSVLLI